ncbi:hypothetical protein [Microcoleus sp. D3_18a_C4]|uniref:hypothetical protein n=1 Tax=Microcoleus sp. D3_18a_C4 TaxID=3055332 RepID=UPI002FCFC94D
MKKRDNFDSKTIDTLAKRASYICSRPECKALTICRSDTISDKSMYIGKAAHITAAAVGGPRYDESLSVEQRRAIENAIFLCSSCADMIDKNNGVDFPTEVLRNWKLQHEEWVRCNLNKSIFSLIPKEADQSNERPIIEICRRGISVVEVEKDKLDFSIPYCSGKNANAYSVKLEVAVIEKQEDEFLESADNGSKVRVLSEFDHPFPDNTFLTYETGKSIDFSLHPVPINCLSRIYIGVKGSYKDGTETLDFDVFDVFKYSTLSKSWVRLLGKEDRVVRKFFDYLWEFKNIDGNVGE